MSRILKIVSTKAAVSEGSLRLSALWRSWPQHGVRRTATTTSATEQVVSEEAARPFHEIPGPKGLPFIGTSLDYSPFGRFPMHTEMANSTVERYKEHGKIYREMYGTREMVHLCDPKDFETVFRSEGRFPVRPVPGCIAKYRRVRKKPQSVVQLAGEEWARVRGSVNKYMLRPKSAGAYTTKQDNVSRDLVDIMKAIVRKGDSNGQVPNFTKTLYKYALESISVVVLGRRLGCLTLEQLAADSDAQRMITAVNDFFLLFAKLETSIPLFKYMNTPTWKKFEKASDTIASVTEKMVGETFKDLRGMEEPPDEQDFLTSLLSRKDITFDEALLLIVDLLNGSIDSTAHTLVFNLFCLAKNPSAQQKLYEEIMEVVPPGQPVDERMINKMHYLRAVVKETHRLYPTILNNARTLTRDVVLSGYHVPAKTTVLMAQNVLSTMPEYYPEPEAYKPERWLRAESGNVQTFTLLPFGYGPRMCLGRRFAEQELYLGLIRIIQSFHVAWEGEDMKQVWRIVNAPDRDSFVFRERQ